MIRIIQKQTICSCAKISKCIGWLSDLVPTLQNSKPKEHYFQYEFMISGLKVEFCVQSDFFSPHLGISVSMTWTKYWMSWTRNRAFMLWISNISICIKLDQLWSSVCLSMSHGWLTWTRYWMSWTRNRMFMLWILLWRDTKLCISANVHAGVSEVVCLCVSLSLNLWTSIQGNVWFPYMVINNCRKLIWWAITNPYIIYNWMEEWCDVQTDASCTLQSTHCMWLWSLEKMLAMLENKRLVSVLWTAVSATV